MKKTHLLFVCFLVSAFINAMAQKPPALNFPTYRQDVDSTFKLFDKKKIPTQILYDKVYPMASLQDYSNGITDTMTYSRFLQANNELKNASYNSLTMLTSSKLKYYNDNASRGDTIRFGVLNFTFNQVNPDADTNIVHSP